MAFWQRDVCELIKLHELTWAVRQVTQVKSLWHRRGERRIAEWAVTQVKQRKDWRMSCDVRKAMEGLENELWRRWNDGKVGEWTLLILQPFRHFTHVTAPSPTLPSLHLRHSSFSKPFASLTSQALHLRRLASRQCELNPCLYTGICGLFATTN